MDPKAELRSRMRALRRRLAAEAPDAGGRAAANLPAGWPGRPVGAYGLYHPTGSELDPSGIELEGVRALPAVVVRDAPLVFRPHAPGGLLAPDALGIAAPPAAAGQVRPDVLFVPVLAFDRLGGRLGQGGGFYDRTIAALRAGGPLLAVGVAFAGQELPEVPLEPHDARLDAILTETAFIPVATGT
ncbi:5-formyltetrahydrofolate cyclo-ligase [Phenylobacterium sp.]|uniref:5-formyltetrahydrofolate cyclo-ligase n=1 Tax=Phenylobacterium sp. TaxID=1871053 RepID=UPI00301CA8F4